MAVPDAAPDPDHRALDLGAHQDAALRDERALERAALDLGRGQEARVRVDRPRHVVEVEGRHRVAQLPGWPRSRSGSSRRPPSSRGRSAPARAGRRSPSGSRGARSRRARGRRSRARAPRGRRRRCPSTRGSPCRSRASRTRAPGSRSGAGFSSKCTMRPWRLTFRIPKPPACVSAHRQHRHRGVGHVPAVGVEHLAEVHLVELVARQDQHLAAPVAHQVPHALAHGVRRALEPLGAVLGLLGREHRDEGRAEDVELVRHASGAC